MTNHRVRITHSIGNIRQPRQNDCWAASLAMVVGRRRGHPLWVGDIQRIAAGARVVLNADGSIPRGNGPNISLLATTLRLRFHNVMSQSFNLPLITRLLRPGSFALFGDFDYSGRQRFHVIAVYRLFGDGTPSGTTISYVDPYSGRYINKQWIQFYNADEGGSFLADPHFVVGH